LLPPFIYVFIAVVTGAVVVVMNGIWVNCWVVWNITLGQDMH